MALIIFLFFLICSSVALSELSVQCPPKESLPCTCSIYSSGIGVYACNTINSAKDFQDILEALKGYKVYKLDVYGVNTSMLSTDLFQGLHIRHLSLYSVRADDASLGHSHFVGLENSLEELIISFRLKGNTSLSTVELVHLHSLKIVRFLALGNRELENGWFKGPKSLESFQVSISSLEKLGDKIFASQTNLKELSLSYNRLEEISRSMLPYPAKHLKTLDLGNNKIRTLPRDIFSGMPELTEVKIENNLIQTLPEDTWSPVFSKLGKIFDTPFKGNPLRCDEDLKWACNVNASLLGGETKCASPDDLKGLHVKKFCEKF